MSSLDTILWVVAGLAVLVSLMNPGGLIIGLGIALVLLGARYGLPFLGDLARQRQSGVGRAKVGQKVRDGVRNSGDRGDNK